MAAERKGATNGWGKGDINGGKKRRRDWGRRDEEEADERSGGLVLWMEKGWGRGATKVRHDERDGGRVEEGRRRGRNGRERTWMGGREDRCGSHLPRGLDRHNNKGSYSSIPFPPSCLPPPTLVTPWPWPLYTTCILYSRLILLFFL